MKSSANLIEFIESWEGCRLTPYLDGGDKLTVGIGHLVQPHELIQNLTEDDCRQLLSHDLENAEDAVNYNVKMDLKQNQFDALVDFVFNLGAGNFEKSHLLQYLNAGNYDAAANAFMNWNHINGVVSEGLTRRRAAERILFITGVYGNNE